MHEILKRIGDLGIIPTIKIEKEADALAVGRALLAAELPIAEITFRTGACTAAIKALACEMPEILLGAGTVLHPEQAEEARIAGARFIVTPGFNPEVVERCQEWDVPVIPGCATPTEIEAALGYDLEAVKFFPAEQYGGTAALKAFAGPYPSMAFVPTSGIDNSNLGNYLSLPNVLAVAGSWLVKDDLIKSGNFAEITRLTREAVRMMLNFQLAHVGLNMPDAASAQKTARDIGALLDWPPNSVPGGVFAGTAVEVKENGRGQHGHIAVSTRSLRRALAFLSRRGVTVDKSTLPAEGKSAGPVYLNGEWGGFALHLIEKA